MVQQRPGCVRYSGGRVPNTVPRVRWRQQSSEESKKDSVEGWKGRARAKINSALVFLLNFMLTCQEHCCDVNTNPVVWPVFPVRSFVWTAFSVCDSSAKDSKRYFLLLLLFYKDFQCIFFLSCDNKPSSVTTNWEIVCVFFLVGCLTEVTAMSLTLDPRTCTAVFLPQEGNPCLHVWELCRACKM